MKIASKKKTTSIRILSLVLGIIFSSLFLTSCGGDNQANFNSYEEINKINPVIGITETLEAEKQAMELMPNATLSYYTDFSAALNNLKNGKYDGLIGSDFLVNEAIENDEYNVKSFEQPIQTYQIGLGLAKNTKISNFSTKVNQALEKFRADGTLKEMNKNWNEPGAKRIMPVIPLDGYTEEIKCATFGQQKPTSYFDGSELKGFDVELLYRVANELGCKLSIETADYPSLLLGLGSGKYDIVAANLYITEQREENFLFSSPYGSSSIKMLVNDPQALEFGSYTSLEGKHKLAVITGGACIDKVKARFPEGEIVYCNSIGDGILAVQNKKADAFFHDGPVLNFACSVYKDFGLIPEKFYQEKYCFLTSKDETGITIKNNFNEWLANYKTSGKLEESYKFWTSNEEARLFDFDSLPGEKGTIKVGLFLDSRPATFLYNNTFTGFPDEIIYEFCKDNGYKAEFLPETAESFIPAITSHKIDIMTGFIAYTDERAEKVEYTDTICEDGIAAFVRRVSKDKSGSIIDWFVSGFKKTFIDEDRYKMIFKGLGTTLLITISSFILANILGACFCSLSLSKRKWVKGFNSVYQYIIQGTPVVVILMILYYIIFGNVRVSGEFIAIIGFSLVSGAGLAQLFKGGIESVDRGQKEASLALGFSRTQTFMGITLPQTIRKILPAYFRELISLLKATSIVGYISVIDLTRTGDIIRSATFEAFFPLIAVAIFYFVIIALLLMVLGFIQKALNKRKEVPVKKEEKQND